MTSTPRPELDLPGYSLIDRIGSGGYGEVWRASAPGGLVKAIKIVYGRSDQSHAASELRALEKIKSVRHPFLLSLERFEVIDNRLLVVMELAEGSLRDRYRECRDAGHSGIERGELLRYLRDAADALDYLTQKHDLQHLDIKPENLLLVGGHVKIADFGLVKNLHAPQASIIGGMTPTYAAPELFQGRPTPHSDQYSLAIIYQELLTGTVPFEGSSAAELTLKHINELPSLDPLSEGDRFVISQALAKDPEHRFGSCSEMVDALMRVAAGGGEPSQPTPQLAADASHHSTHRRPLSTSLDGPAPPTATLLFDEGDSNWAKESAPILIELPEIAPLQIVAGPEPDAGTWKSCPTLVIGMGGSGKSVLERFRTSLASIDSQPLSHLAMLQIDSDPQSIPLPPARPVDGTTGPALETVNCPLRRPQDYRDKSDKLLKWMSRRWLYNIPRSLRTESIRALGRLVFVDHARQVIQRIRQLVRQVVDSASATGHTGPLRIYLVGSVSGGTASGMMNDVAYAIRAMLTHLSIDDAELIALATHSPSRVSEMMELSRVNSFSWLAELAHWSQPGQIYPGDETVGIPPVESSTGPFDHVYVLGLGDRVDDRRFDAAMQDIADYLLLDTTSPAGAWITRCRQRARQTTVETHPLTLRTFAVNRSPEVDRTLATIVARKLIRQWGTSFDHNDGCLTEAVSIPDTPTTVESLVNLARQIVDQQLEGNAVGFLGKRMLAAGITPATLALENALPLIEQIIPVLSSREEGQLVLDGHPLEELTQAKAAELASRVSAWFAHRVGSATGVPRQLLDEADELSKRLATAGDELQSQVDTAWRTICDSTRLDATDRPVEHQVLGHWRQRLQLVVARLALQLCEIQSKWVEIIAQDIDSLLQFCRQLAETSEPADPVEWPTEIAPILDQRLRVALVGQGGYHGLWSAAEGTEQVVDRVASLLPPILRSFAMVGADDAGCLELTDPRQQCSLGPRLRFQGGECSQLIVGPDPAPSGPGGLGAAYLQVPALSRTFTLFEAGGLSTLHVAATFVSGRRDYADMAGRVHTRRDIAWRPLLQKPTDATDSLAPSPFADLVHDTENLCLDLSTAGADAGENPSF